MPKFPFTIVISIVCGLLVPLISASTAPISSYPLAVRNPYLSAWLPQNVSSNAPTARAQFWNGQYLTWPIIARVDGKAYTLFGEVNGVNNTTAAQQTDISFTATHTIIRLTAGSANIELDFFSPVSPANYLRQSLPYSYLTVTATSQSNPTVEVFSGIDSSWTGATANLASQFQKSGTSFVHTITNPQQTLFKEVQQQAAWGTVVFASQPLGSNVITYQSGSRSDITESFINSGKLSNNASPWAAGNIYAFSSSLGRVGADGQSARFAVGYDRTSAVNFLNQPYSPYSKSKYPNAPEAVAHFLDDYSDAFNEAQELDAKVTSKGQQFSTEYTDLLEASVRQIYGAMEIVIPQATLNTNDALVFLKEISSNGDVSTVDVIYPTVPALYLLGPDWIQLLLKPYLIYLNTGNWPHDYIPHDLGTYPNATGHNAGNDEQILVEATGSFCQLLQLYQKASGSSASWLQPYLNVLYKAGDYLVKNGLYPAAQLSTVDGIRPATANQTGLAQSAAVGLKSLGAALALQNYTNAGMRFGNQIYPGLGTDNATNPTHFTYNYDKPSSWVTTFDLFVDSLLALDTFPDTANRMQAAWYAQQFLPSGGAPYSYNVDFVVSEWLVWAGAVSNKISPSAQIQEMAIAMVHKFITNGKNNVPFPTKFNVKGSNIGVYINNRARPTVGSMWAPMALNGNWGTGI